ncbi:hypothetical protein DICVIV_07352 [Dictyocaulus viviparus]|uniref:Uncharacterized protein n=1 Tax=Dictyocaulus viviparus TaxID=29172 RepID=A0A0D8XS34_DICVI|nr:hypothetical protein DICVIV_07352 [Dictyocaulus viviparus]
MDSWSTYQNLPPDQVNWADLAQRWMAMRSAQDDHRPCADLNGYGGHFGSDSGPPTHYNRSIGYENYGRGDMNGQFHQAPDQNYGRGPERGLRDIGLHDNYQHDDWSSSTSGPNRPIFPAAAQTKSDVRNLFHSRCHFTSAGCVYRYFKDFHDGFRGEWGGAPPPPPAHDHPEYYRTPNQPPNQYFQHDFAHGHPSSRNWSSSHPNGPPLRGGPAVGGPPLPSGAQLHGLTGTIGPPIRGSPPPGGPPPPGGNPPASGWYPSPFYPPPFASNVPNTTIASHHQSGAENSSTPPFFTMDASTRKKLPAWILEGLEKAEREKMKQIEKEERMKRAEEERAKRRVLAGKGRFDSSSEDEDEEQTDDERSRNKLRQSCSVNDDGEPVFLARRANLLADDPRTEEEKKDDAMATVKFIMMSLLMEATDEALRTSISDSIRDTKHEAEPKLLANSSALAALSSLGGGDESDDESDGEEKKENGNKSHNGGASSSSESGDENSVFKTPLGAPRKTSKQTTTSTGNESEVDLETVDVNRENVKGALQGIVTGEVGVANADEVVRRRAGNGNAVDHADEVRRAIEGGLVNVCAVARVTVDVVARLTANVVVRISKE